VYRRASPPKLRVIPRWLRLFALGLLYVCLALGGLLCVGLVALNSEPGRKRITGIINATLATQFAGRLEILEIERLDLAGAHGIRASLEDPQGRPVAQVQGADVRANIAELGVQLLRRASPLRIRVSTLTVRHAEVRLIDTGGRLSIEDALMTRAARASDSPTPNRAPSLDILLSNIVIQSAAVTLERQLAAEVSELRASLHATAAGLDLELSACNVRAQGIVEVDTAQGQLRGSLHLQPQPEPADASWLLQSQFEGAVAAVPVSLSLDYDARPAGAARWMARLATHDVPASALRRWVPGLTLAAPLDVRASAQGSLAAAQVELDATLGRARLHAQGNASLQPRLGAELAIDAQELNTRSLFAAAPNTLLNLVARLQLSSTDAGLRSRIEFETQRSRLEATPLPDTHWVAELAGRAISGRVQLLLPDAPTRIDFTLPSGTGPRRLGFDLQSDLSANARSWTRLPGLPRLTARGHLSARGDVAFSASLPTIDAELRGAFDQLAASGLRAQRLRLRASAHGPLRAPHLKLMSNVGTLSGWGHELRGVSARGHGTLRDLHWQLDVPTNNTHTPELHLSGRLDASSRRLSNLELALERGGSAVHVRSRAVEFFKTGFEISELELQGAGRLRAELRVQGQQVQLQAAARELNLEVLAELAGLQSARIEGLATFDTEAQFGAARSSGNLRAQVRNLAFRGIRAGSLNADLQLENGFVRGQIEARAGPSAELRLRAADFELPRSWSSAELRGGRGRLELESSVELGHLQRLGLDSMLPLASAAGRLTLQAELSRNPGALASLTARVRTQGLAWQPIHEAEATAESWPGTWRAIDLDLRAAIERSDASLELTLLDPHGALLHMTSRSRWSEMRLDSLASFDITHLPFVFQLELPRRTLASLPARLRPPGVAGQVQAELSGRGSLAAPVLTGDLDLSELEFARKSDLPLHVHATGDYKHGRAEVSLVANTGDTSVLDARGTAAIALPAALRGHPEFNAALTAHVSGFRLNSLAFLGDPTIDGSLDGHMELSGLGARPEGQIQLRVSPLTLAGLAGQRLSLDASAHDGHFQSQLALEQPGGLLRASLDAKLIWQGLGLPEIDPGTRMQAEISAQDVRLLVLRPFIPRAQRNFDGVLGAHLIVDTAQQNPLSGQASVREGVLQVPALGQEFRDVRADLVLSPGGRLQLLNAAARAVAGEVQLHGEADLTGITLQRGSLTLGVGKRQQIPVTLQGVPVGTAWGELKLTAARSGSGIDLILSVPTLHVDLPSIAPRAVQQLDPDPTISTGVFVDDGRFVVYDIAPRQHDKASAEARQPLPLHVELGRDVWIHRGANLQVRLTGPLEAVLAETPRLTGTLSVPEGQLDVQGRLFQLQDSTLTFQGNEDPDNPVVIATARWVAPDGYEVYAEFVGPIKTGKLSLRSEPPLDDNGILSLLLFGSPDGLFGASASAEGSLGAATALGAGGSVLTMGLNRQLQEITSLDIRTRIDQSGGRAHPEIALQLSPRVTAELAYDLATPSPGESPDTTFLTLDMRLLRNWSLSTTVGNQGSTFIDMSWRYRY
jgi:translocation and assembly module TamB